MDDGGTTVAQAWRPQRFGNLRAGAISDPIIEPLWGGDRTLVIVSAAGERPRFVDEHGEPLEDPLLEPIVAELATSLRADSVVLDGYLTRQPNVDPGLAIKMRPQIPTHGQVLGALFLGSSGTKVAKAIERTEAAPAIDPDLPLTFVAVDLLAIDDQPLLDVPLLERKRILETAFEEADLVRRSAFVRPPAGTFLVSWRAFGFVEIAYKSANSRYTPGQPNPGWAVATIPTR
jgi:hypothetical protein